jgi:phosphohistidine phosphatase SixA
MQRLILLRHAEAEMSADAGDFARALTARGRREALAAGQALAARGLVPDIALVSPAARALQTWEAVAPALPPVQAEFDPALYHAEAGSLLEAAEASGAASVLLVAHNPGLHQLALGLAGKRDEEPLSRLRHFAPAAAAAFRFDCGRAHFETAVHPGEPPPPVYKILPASDWAEAMASGAFPGSADDARDGFIHLSAAHQVAETARRHFKGREGLVLVAFDPGRLGPALKWEPSRGGALFPHLYGPLPTAAAVEARELPLGPDGAPDAGRLV